MAEKQDDNLLKSENSKDKSNLVIDENTQGFVYDIYDIIETSVERPAIRARNLIQAGVSIDVFVEAYTGITSNVSNIEEALVAIDETFIHLAKVISNYPNGIVIDLETGMIDERASEKQARLVGIHDDGMKKTWEEKVNERIQEALKNDNERKTIDEKLNIKEKENNLIEIMSRFNDYFNNKNFDINKFFDEYDENLINDMPKDFREYINERKNLLSKYTKEEAEYMRIEHELEHNKSGPRFMELLRQRTKFLEKHPELLEFQTRDKEGKLDSKIDEYMDAERDVALGVILSKFKGVELDNVENPTIKKFMVITALAASNIEAYKGDALSVLGLEGSSLEERLVAINKILGTRMKTKEDLQVKKDLFLKALEHAMDISEMFNSLQTEKISDQEIDELIERMGENLNIKNIEKTVNLSVYQKHFKDSKLEFTKSDEEALKKGFKEATNDSWVNSEKDAKELLLAARIFKIEELEKINNKTMTGQSALNSQKRKLAKILETYPDLKKSLDENGNLKDDVRIKAKNFEDSKRKAVILSKYMKDLSFKKEFSREDFDEYTNVEKRDYYRMALIGLEYAEKNNDPVLKKLALRRFENLNTDELKFITINEDGSYKLNEKVIVDEYNEINSATTYDNLYDLRRKLVSQYNETNVSGRLEEMIEHGIEPIENMADMSLEDKYTTIMEMRERANAKSVAKKQQDKLEKHEYMLKMTEMKKAKIVSQNKSRQENNDQEKYEGSRDEGETKVNEEPESIIEFENTDKSLWSKVKDFVKQKILRNNQLRLPGETGKKENKKEGFFAKLFGALKDDNSKNNNSKEKSVIKLESKMDAYKIENSDGRIEQGATDLSNSNKDSAMVNNLENSQIQEDQLM